MYLLLFNMKNKLKVTFFSALLCLVAFFLQVSSLAIVTVTVTGDMGMPLVGLGGGGGVKMKLNI